MSKSKSSKTLFTYKTELNADSVEWCPHEPFQHIFVCANYQLQTDNESPATKKRIGKILLFSIDPINGLNLHQTINTCGVLDQKWCHNRINNHTILGVVNSEKQIEIYKLNSETLQLELLSFYSICDDNSETLILSLDWSTGKYLFDPEIICSDSKGNIHKLGVKNNQLVLEQSWKGHDFEAWIAAFYYWDSNITFTGGDDCLFLKFDKRLGTTPVIKNRSHEAGVTSIHSNSNREYTVATGSYDTYTRLWDLRNMKNPLNSIKMPGTLWRLKWDPFYYNYLLATCMLGGIHVIKAKKSEELNITASCYEHDGLCYGGDWCYLQNVKDFNYDGTVIIGSCSFYNNLLCISKIKL